MKFLIVDDIDINRMVLRVAFEAEGHTALEASDGIEALEILGREDIDASVSVANLEPPGIRLTVSLKKA